MNNLNIIIVKYHINEHERSEVVNNTLNENNLVNLIGKAKSGLEFSHEMYGEGFYLFYFEVSRLSDAVDIIPITISERLITEFKIEEGMLLEVEGQFRSYNNVQDTNSKLVLTVFAREVKLLDDEKKLKNPNQIYLDGFICKKPNYRTTPFGREICDILIAVNRMYNKSDYIPCIAWGRNARYCENLKLGDRIKVWGRIQSRGYEKNLENGEIIRKTAYEISVSKLEIIDKEEKEGHI